MYKLYFDGASRGNPGKASYGGVIITPFDTELITYKNVLPDKTSNNVAEYTGLLEGLKIANMYCIENLEVYGDSILVINQLNGEWKVKHPNMEVLYKKCKFYQEKFKHIEFNHVKRNLNKRADALANEALD